MKRVIVVWILLSVFLFGCSRENPRLDKQPTMKDFQETGNFWTDAEVETMIQQDQIGKMPEEAVVPLVFNENGKLFTPEEYGAFLELHVDDEEHPLTYFTDLTTYYAVTQESGATAEHVQGMSMNSQTHYVYDPYVLVQAEQ